MQITNVRISITTFYAQHFKVFFLKCSHLDSTSPSESAECKPFKGSDGNGEG